MLVVSAKGVNVGVLTAKAVRAALNHALQNPPRAYYLTNNHDDSIAAEVPVYDG